MPAPITPGDIRRYGDLLAEIKARVDYAARVLQEASSSFYLEEAAVQLRIVIESIAMGTLIVNRMSLAGVTRSLHEMKWDEARSRIRSLNPGYWPVPLQPGAPEDGVAVSLEVVDSPFLEESQAGREWGYLSDLLHASNPLRDVRDVSHERHARLGDILARIVTLLNFHTIDLGGRDHLILADMNADGSGDVLVTVVEQVRDI